MTLSRVLNLFKGQNQRKEVSIQAQLDLLTTRIKILNKQMVTLKRLLATRPTNEELLQIIEGVRNGTQDKH